MGCKNGGKELEDPTYYLQQNSTTIQLIQVCLKVLFFFKGHVLIFTSDTPLMSYIRNHQMPFQTDSNGNLRAIMVQISNVTALLITTAPDVLCFIYLKNCLKKRKTKRKMKK